MTRVYYPERRRGLLSRRQPALVFIVLSVALFFVFHWHLETQRTLGDYNMSQEDLTAQMAGSPVRQVVLIILLVMGSFSFVLSKAQEKLRLRGPLGWFLVAFASWALVSALWAEDPEMTMKRLVSFGILCVVAVAVVRYLSLREVVLWIFTNMALLLVVSIVAEVFSGAFHPFAHGYRFSGIQHPNAEGVECGLLILSAIAAAKMEKKYQWLYRSFAVLGFGILMLTASRTSLAGTLLASMIYLTVKIGTQAKVVMASVLCTLICAFALFSGSGTFSGAEHVIGAGRDDAGGVESFAGRTAIWTSVGPYIAAKPMGGYGYGGFWTPAHMAIVSDSLQWGVPDSHSAYVDYVLTLGVVGLVLYTGCLFLAWRRAFELYRMTPYPEFAFLVATLMFCTIDGFLESSVGEGTLPTFLLLLVLFQLALVPRQGKPRLAFRAGARLEEARPA